MMIETKLTSKKPARSELHAIAVCSDQLDSIDLDVDKKTLKLTGFDAA